MAVFISWVLLPMKPDIIGVYKRFMEDYPQFMDEHSHFIGNDVVHLPTFHLSLTPEFIQKVYTEPELNYCRQFAEPLLRYASTWAAKEAVYKALKQADAAPAGWKNIEITRHKPSGQPTVVLHDTLQQVTISLTISHDGDYVWAAALVRIK